MTNKYPSIKKLTAYLNGELSGIEADEIKNWFQNSIEDKKELEHLGIIWNLAVRLDQMEKIDRQKAKIAVNSKLKKQKLNWKISLQYFQKIAAIFLLPLLLLSGYLFFFHYEGINSGQEYITSYGTKTSFELPDGSIVWLNSGSKLSYDKDFNRNKRKVNLTGEAFFKVAANKKKPFDVVAGKYTIRAVGTEFNVFSYEENEFETSLEEGLVQVFRSEGSKQVSLVDLIPGQRVYLDQGKLKIMNDDISRFSAWRDGKLIFKNTSMNEVIQKMQRWYNVEIELKDPELSQYSITAIFGNETIQQALEMLSFSSPIEYKFYPMTQQSNNEFVKSKIEIHKKSKY